MEKEQGGAKRQSAGKVLLATVKGDVHDIGKNIVGVVLGCNNYEVINLGVMVRAEEIFRQAREHQADIIGLSGLITPSLDEMVHVATQMQHHKFDTPLLIGGATTSVKHTAVKIEPCYQAPTVHVKDASRVVQVAQKLLNPDSRPDYHQSIRAEYEVVRQRHLKSQARQKLLPLAEARRRRFAPDWQAETIETSEAMGVTTMDNIGLDEITPFIDWSPFFHAWELRGRFPDILQHAKYGEKAAELYQDGQTLLRHIIENQLLRARAVHGFFPANSIEDDVVVYADPGRSQVLTTFHFLRQQLAKGNDKPNYCLADFIAPQSSGRADVLGAFAVTAGAGLDDLCRDYEADHDDYNAIMAKVLADRLAEALAEMLHQKVRRLWGYGKNEELTVEDLIREKYRGIRPAPGYPACPDHTEKRLLFDLLQAERCVGITLTENFAMHPASSVSGFYFAHPEAVYFNVSKIDRDQVRDYAQRKQCSPEDIERWLGPNLSYTPERAPVLS